MNWGLIISDKMVDVTYNYVFLASSFLPCVTNYSCFQIVLRALFKVTKCS